MASPTPAPTTDEQERAKARWIKPVVDSLDVGEAEGADGSGPDGGLAS